jgi:hypothetical protein
MLVLEVAPVRVTAVLVELLTDPPMVKALVARVTVGPVRFTFPSRLRLLACSKPDTVVKVPAATLRLYRPYRPSRMRLPVAPEQTIEHDATLTEAPW